MNSAIKVSVLTPIYNHKVEYVRRCLESLKYQTLQEIEFILIDNGAPEYAKKVIYQYEKNDTRFTVLHIKKNEGYSKAINIGLENARGEYIGIVESDDWVEPNMFEKLYNIAIDNNVSLVKSIYFEEFENKRVLNNPFNEEVFNKTSNIEDLKDFLQNHASPWSMIYKRQMLNENNIRISSGTENIAKDIGFVIKAFLSAKKVYIMDSPFYHYNLANPNQSMKISNLDYILKMQIYEYENIYKWFNDQVKKHILPEKYRAYIDKRLFFNIECHLKSKKISTKNLTIIVKQLSRLIKDTTNFSTQEQNTLKNLLNSSIKNSKQNYKNILHSIFSIGNINNKKHKQITILGIKIKFKRKRFTRKEQKLLEEIRNIVRYETSLAVTREVSMALTVQKLHMQTFPRFKNINTGKSVAIIGCGSTVKYYNLELDTINIALNKSILLEQFKFKYLFSWDYNGFINYGELDFFEKVRKFDCIKFFGRFLSEMSPEIPALPDDLENNIYHFYSSARYGLPAGNYGRIIHSDIESHPLADFMSVSFPALQFALYTQPAKIYLIGLDTTNSGHILDCKHEYYIKDLMEGYKKFKEHINRFYPQIEIISVNPVGLKGLFKDVYT